MSVSQDTKGIKDIPAAAGKKSGAGAAKKFAGSPALSLTEEKIVKLLRQLVGQLLYLDLTYMNTDLLRHQMKDLWWLEPYSKE